ncbi:hypothetical protein amrb99_14100 [Actinomadura sp. RB99]|nr:hypothetical protein [Actinomadura sp. RB99]
MWGLTDAQTVDVELVVSELVTNAVSQARHEKFRVRICEEIPGTLTIEVWDPVLAPPYRKFPNRYAGTGRGLLIVEALAAHSGWRPVDGGKWVFTVVEVPPYV